VRALLLLIVGGWALLYGSPFSEIAHFFSEENLIRLLKEYGYIILFIWSFFEGETGLIMAGILSYTGDMNLYLSILVAALGGFLGDQFYFYLGRFNKKWVLEEFKKHRRKVAQARLLLNRYGGWVIFIQRFLYGLRTILPITIGVTGYDPRKFAIINLISAFIWASISIVLAYIFGEQLLNLLKWVKNHWYLALPVALGMVGGLYYLSHRDQLRRAKEKEERDANRLQRRL
jgi:membrane protein DedA with SNARE-associated domain